MGKTLVVIESPGKLKSYQKYLGSDYEIVASYGHVIDLPQSKGKGGGAPKGGKKKGGGGLGVDIEDDFRPTYEVMADKADTVASIVAKAKRCDLTLLMTDPDREGEAISWHLSTQFPPGVKFKRAATASITKPAILEAIKKAGDINMRLVDSYETRRILDRLCGFKTSFLVKQATGGMSAGRVQSAALRILAEREKEVRAFVPVEYWPVDAELLTAGKKKLHAHVVAPDPMDTKNEAAAKKVKGTIEKGPVTVASYDVRPKSESAPPPFTTSKLQAAAASMFGWSQDRTMKVAQGLYESGHITYMRTDSTHIEPGPLAELRAQATEKYGADHVSPTPNSFRSGKNAQEAHEAIRPTHFEVSVVGSGDEQKLYAMIWKRAVASQMRPELREVVAATFRAGDVTLRTSGSRQTFAGWKACWDYRDATDTFLPPMKVGEQVEVLEVAYEQKHTEPPPRYGVATFNSKLEELGIARPSTLATVTKTLQARGYIETKGNTHHVTDLGLRVTDFLVSSNFCFADTTFTREMEEKLDDILHEKAEKLAVLKEFWKRLSDDLKRAGGKKAAINRTEHPCPLCAKAGRDARLVQKFSRFGPFFSCELHADKDVKCEFTATVGEAGEPVPKVKKAMEESDHACDVCGQKLLVRHGQYGDFLGCRNWNKDERCKGIFQMDGSRKPPSTGGPRKRFWGRKKKGS